MTLVQLYNQIGKMKKPNYMVAVCPIREEQRLCEIDRIEYVEAVGAVVIFVRERVEE